MSRIAIVGNIASGKSSVEKILEEKGYKVFDTDKIAHKILENNSKVEKVFGTTDRKILAHIVFNNPEKMKELENIIHPLVKEEILKIEEGFISVPQLFEAGYESLFDKIIFVSTSEKLRLERLMKRNNLSKKEATKRIKAQLPEDEKIKKSDFVIKNEGNFEKLQIEVEKVLDALSL